MKHNYLFSLFVVLTALLGLCLTLANAQDWDWQLDPSFFSSNLEPEMETIGSQYASGMYDLNDDGKPEYILFCQQQEGYALELAEMEGDFPNIRWTLHQDFFPAIEYAPDARFNLITFYDLEEDGSVEIILNGRFVFRNSGDFENPDWARADDLIPELDVGDCLPQVCDWDNDGLLDLIAASYPTPDSDWVNQGFYRYELTEEGDWDSLGYTEIGMGLLQRLADLDRDGDLDLIEASVVLYTLGHPRRDWEDYYIEGTQIVFNEGTPNEPDWSRSILTEDLDMPIPIDLNSDDYLDMVDGWSYCLNLTEDDTVIWDRQVSWRGIRGAIYAAADFAGDERLEFLCGSLHSRSFMDHRWRLVQNELTPVGWRDAQFFGDDFAYWGSGFTDLWAIRTGDFLQNGQTQIVLAKSIGMGVDTPSMTLFEDQDEGEDWDWQPVAGFFDGLIDPDIYVFKPAFGDFDQDGDQDVALMRQFPDDSLLIHIFEYRPEEQDGHWVQRPDWGNEVFDTLQVRSLTSGDFDGDGSCDLITVDNDDRQLRIFRNVSHDGEPVWRYEQEALSSGGPEHAYEVIVADVDLDGKPDLIADGMIYLNQTVNSVAAEPVLPSSFNLSAYPNPFNSSTTITYGLGKPVPTRLALYDLSGREVRTLFDGYRQAGFHSVNLNANDLSSGLYFVRLEASREIQLQKVMLVK